MKYQTATKSQLWNLVKNLQKQLADTQDALNTRNLDLMKEQEKVEDLEETVSIGRTAISSLEIECKGYFSQLKELEGNNKRLKYNRDRLLEKVEKQDKAIDSLHKRLTSTIDQLVDKNNENEELRGRFGALVHEHSTEVTECTKLLQQLKEHNQILNIDIDKKNKDLEEYKKALAACKAEWSSQITLNRELKEEAALLRKYEAVAQKREEKQDKEYKQVETHYHNAAGRMEEAKDYLWSMYDDLLQNKEIEKSDLKFVIGLMYY